MWSIRLYPDRHHYIEATVRCGERRIGAFAPQRTIMPLPPKVCNTLNSSHQVGYYLRLHHMIFSNMTYADTVANYNS